MSRPRIAGVSPPAAAAAASDVPPSRSNRPSESRSRGLIAAIDRPPPWSLLRQGHHVHGGKSTLMIGNMWFLGTGISRRTRAEDPQRPPGGESGDVLNGVPVERPIAIIRHISKMRGQYCPWSRTQRMSPRQRFLNIDVKTRSRDTPRAQGRQQRVLVHDRPAG